jgi:hypothetical protein
LNRLQVSILSLAGLSYMQARIVHSVVTAPRRTALI